MNFGLIVILILLHSEFWSNLYLITVHYGCWRNVDPNTIHYTFNFGLMLILIEFLF